MLNQASEGNWIFGACATEASQPADQRAGRESISRDLRRALTRIADLMPAALWIRDPEDRIIFSNRAMERIWGRPGSDFPNREALIATIHPEDLEKLPKDMPPDVDYPDHRIVRPDGTTRWVRLRVSACAWPGVETGLIVGTAEDVSDFHQTISSLKDNESLYRLLIENQEQLIVKLSPEGRILYASPTCLNLCGTSEQEMLSGIFQSHIHADDLIIVSVAFRTLNRPPHSAAFEARSHTRQGLRWISWLARAQLDERGNVQSIIAAGRDVTDHRRAADEMTRAMEQAQQANREKDSFLAMLSHELRTPLTPVLAAISSMEQEPDLPAALRSDLVMVHRNIDLEARLIDDLLDLTRISRGQLRLEPRVVDAHELLARAIEIAAPDISSKHIHLRTCFKAPRAELLADPARIQQVFWNIIKNAVLYTDTGGRISVETRADGGGFVVRVIDNGIGIDPQFLPRIFDAFEQERQPGRHGALGLGLAISRTVIDLHGGSISAQSEGRGKGSTFTVVLPLADATTPQELIEPQRAPHAKCEGVKILLVEDHPATREVLGRLLQKMGYAVISAGSLREATQVADADQFDLLISDIGLPDGSGLQLIEHMRDRKHMRSIALTGYGMDNDVQECREAGFDAHLTKPVDIQVLAEAINEVLTQ